ncbi:MAG: ACP S-malonyltransferase [Nocardioidaceae bacterium]
MPTTAPKPTPRPSATPPSPSRCWWRTGLVAALSLFPHPSDAFAAVGAAAGHSVGEITAAAGLGVVSAEQAMVLVRERGKAMAAAAAERPTSMTAVLGGDREEVLAALVKHGLTAANDNGPGQIVAAGTVEQLAVLRRRPSREGTPGAPERWPEPSTPTHMKPAVASLSRLAISVSTHDPRSRLISNRDGHVIHDGTDVLRRLVTQVSTPVRWDLCMQTMSDLGVTGILEMPPAGTLTGIAKRALKGVETLALKTPDQLEDARAFVRKHADGSGDLDSSPTWRLVVSPAKGTFHAADGISVGSPLRSSADNRFGAQPSGPDPGGGATRRHRGRAARRGR